MSIGMSIGMSIVMSSSSISNSSRTGEKDTARSRRHVHIRKRIVAAQCRVRLDAPPLLGRGGRCSHGTRLHSFLVL
jgi:hypothetical protein